MKTEVVAVAAGFGKRFGSPDKVFIKLNGKPIFIWSLHVFEKVEEITGIWLVTRAEMIEKAKEICSSFSIRKIRRIIEGGTERQDSVYNALKVMPDDTDIVLIHDAARPFLGKELIKRLLNALKPDIDGVIPLIPLTDTIKWIKKDNVIGGTLNRESLKAVQTPQAFWYKKLIHAYNKAYNEKFYGTDDASLIEKYGGSVIGVDGDEKNIKITKKQDLEMLKSGVSSLRIGIGYDSHRLALGRKLIIGGVEIPFEKGLTGHSDADVLLHAIIDAILGSAGIGDIGTHFPERDPKYKDISSLVLVEKTLKLVKSKDIEVLWIDCTIFAEKPRLSSYIPQMKEKLEKLGLNVNIKAKTAEGMGFVGRGEGISAQAVCLSRIKLES